MITKQDLQEAIAECQGTRAPNANTAIKLAAFYTILDHLDDGLDTAQKANQTAPSLSAGYSYAEPPSGEVHFDGESEFSRLIDGRKQKEVWPVLDELMSTIKVMNERLYNSVMRKLQ